MVLPTRPGVGCMAPNRRQLATYSVIQVENVASAESASNPPDTVVPIGPTVIRAPLPSWIATAAVFIASGAVLVLEVVGLRLVGPYVGVTLQTSSAVIGVALGAIAYGAWTGGWLADRIDPRRLLVPAF